MCQEYLEDIIQSSDDRNGDVDMNFLTKFEGDAVPPCFILRGVQREINEREGDLFVKDDQ